MKRLFLAASCLPLATAPPAPAQTITSAHATALTAPKLEGGMAGSWTGTLFYRDYQTNKVTSLPVKTVITAGIDGVTLIRASTYDDGPRVGAVLITSAALYDLKAGTVTSVSLRRGRPVTVETERVTVVAYTDATHWSVRFEADGEDDDKPAKLRTTQTRDGDRVVSVKEVLPASAVAAGWQFRNRTELRRDTGGVG